jgi:hypothetical protein
MDDIASLNALLSRAPGVGPGYAITRDYHKVSGIQVVEGGEELAVVTEELPPGAGIYLTRLIISHLDNPQQGELAWSLRNGGIVVPGFDNFRGPAPNTGPLILPVRAIIPPGGRLEAYVTSTQGEGTETRVTADYEGFYFGPSGNASAPGLGEALRQWVSLEGGRSTIALGSPLGKEA